MCGVAGLLSLKKKSLANLKELQKYSRYWITVVQILEVTGLVNVKM